MHKYYCIKLIDSSNNIRRVRFTLELKDRLKELRKENHLTQEKLGQMIGYGYTAIANYESGRNNPSIRDLKRLADIFDVSLDYLTGYSNNKHNMGKISPAEKKIIKAIEQNHTELEFMDRIIIHSLYHTLKLSLLKKMGYLKESAIAENIIREELEKAEMECFSEFSKGLYSIINNETIKKIIISEMQKY